ncbi:MAG TPA: GNAT family N-acetyltransferase [Bryobacteraceae bacterium]|nr:GNAT family N-acetyltransferase [Bryobacteraceae bacterium]
MLELEFLPMTDRSLADNVLSMMRALYTGDEPASEVNFDRFPQTIDFVLREPDRGRIILFRERGLLRGYALLIPYWSNEFGGTLLFVDELFVVPEARSRGIGHRFFQFISAERPFDAVALALEVGPRNARARALYESEGLTLRPYAVMTKRIVR